jgi:hypothetical protein
MYTGRVTLLIMYTGRDSHYVYRSCDSPHYVHRSWLFIMYTGRVTLLIMYTGRDSPHYVYRSCDSPHYAIFWTIPLRPSSPQLLYVTDVLSQCFPFRTENEVSSPFKTKSRFYRNIWFVNMMCYKTVNSVAGSIHNIQLREYSLYLLLYTCILQLISGWRDTGSRSGVHNSFYSRRSFGLDIGFTDYLNTRLAITLSHSAIANFHTLKWHAKSFPTRSVSTSSCLLMASNNGYSSASVLKSSLNGDSLPTD